MILCIECFSHLKGSFGQASTKDIEFQTTIIVAGKHPNTRKTKFASQQHCKYALFERKIRPRLKASGAMGIIEPQHG